MTDPNPNTPTALSVASKSFLKASFLIGLASTSTVSRFYGALTFQQEENRCCERDARSFFFAIWTLNKIPFAKNLLDENPQFFVVVVIRSFSFLKNRRFHPPKLRD